ncbi:MAG: ribulose-phosphate 3-epimerase [Clostridia bacterium]|nr:ribulose-phosphate 3-epimerase [Clostridia bacterium]
MINIAPSVLAADPLNMERSVQRMLDAGCDWIHVDVMDGHFVPNLGFTPALVRALRRRWPTVPLDVHLMMDNPDAYIREFAEAGATGLTVHAEVAGVRDSLKLIREAGCYAGLALKPATAAGEVLSLLPDCDLILVMTVEPGFGGQHLNAAMLDKLKEFRRLGWTGLLESDGGITLDNLPRLIDAGLDTAVMGTALYSAADPAEAVRRIRAMST